MRPSLARPRLQNADGSLQRSVRGFPTPWRIATEYLFLRKLAPRSRLLNAFYGAGFAFMTASPSTGILKRAAVLLARRDAVDAMHGFLTSATSCSARR